MGNQLIFLLTRGATADIFNIYALPNNLRVFRDRPAAPPCPPTDFGFRQSHPTHSGLFRERAGCLSNNISNLESCMVPVQRISVVPLEILLALPLAPWCTAASVSPH